MASTDAATEANMASSAHFYLNWAKRGSTKWTRSSFPLRAKSTQITASARAAGG